MKQTSFFKPTSTSHGGDLRKKRKGRGARPLSIKDPMHLVLRSSQAKGALSFLKHKATVTNTVERYAKVCGVSIEKFANVGNHLHLEIRITTRKLYAKFIRAVTGRLAQLIAGTKTLTTKFWDHRPFTRVVKSCKEKLILRDYIRINELEGAGISRAEAERIVRSETGPPKR